MKHLRSVVLFMTCALAVIVPNSWGQENCTPECVDLNECEEPLGTCCCPFDRPNDYPSSGGTYHELSIYRLTADQEASFAADNSLSPFWEEWEKGALDFVELLPNYPGNIWQRSANGFEGSEDAQMEVRAAWGEAGLYLFMKVVDDQFVTNVVECIYDPIKDKETCYNPSDIVWANDAIDIYVDKYSTQIIDHTDQWLAPNTDRKTQSMIQIQCQFGVSDPPQTLSINKIDSDNNFVTNRDILIAELAQEWNGMAVDFVNLDLNTKVQEWLIPWDVIGRQPQPGQNPGMALAIGYNDADTDPKGFDALRWRNAADPTKRVQDWATGLRDAVPTEGWGNMVVMDETHAITSVRKHIAMIQNVQSVEYYDLLGKTVATFDLSHRATKEVSLNTGASMLLERITTKSGAIHTQSIMVPQSGLVSRSF